MKRWLAASCALLAIGIAAAHAAVRSEIPATDFTTLEFTQNLDTRLPLDAVFRNSDGRPITLGALFGARPVVLDFEYGSCTTLCGVMLDQLTTTLGTLPLTSGRDYDVVAIDIDPTSTSADAAAFARQHGADKPGMTMLTGDEAEIRRVADAAGFPYRRDPATGQFAHPAGFVIATPDGTISRYLLGLNWSRLDLRLGIVEAAGEKIAAPAERLLLLCYCYDPQTGRYDFAIANLLKAVAAATLLALGGLVWFARRQA